MSELSPDRFEEQFRRFQQLVASNDKGRVFTNFNEGVVAVAEGYKLRLRERALSILAPDAWSEDEIGTGAIVQCTIDAIEIQDSRANLTNNLVFWQNRYGHANRDHRVLLDAVSDPGLRRELERLLFGLYRGGEDEDSTFDRLSEVTGAKYPLLAYLFFLKDMDRFMPIQPTAFDRVFRDLGIDLVTLRNCSWDNYQCYNAALGKVKSRLAALEGLADVRLIEAHSFCWRLDNFQRPGTNGGGSGQQDPGRVLGAREKSIAAMRYSVEDTVRNANGQVVHRIIKNKELRMTGEQLERLLKSLLDRQENRCALTGISLQFHGMDSDKNLLPSVDRIDSNGHYEPENIQVVCRFINFWKGDSDNEEFKRLLMLVRGEEFQE